MSGTQRTIAIVGVWIASMGALTAALTMSLFLSPIAVVIITVVLVAAAVASTYFISQSRTVRA